MTEPPLEQKNPLSSQILDIDRKNEATAKFFLLCFNAVSTEIQIILFKSPFLVLGSLLASKLGPVELKSGRSRGNYPTDVSINFTSILQQTSASI